MYVEMTETQLCSYCGCVYQTLRTYLGGYKFADVERIKVWYYKEGTDKKNKHRRKSLTYNYVLSCKQLDTLKSMIHRHNKGNENE